MNLRWLVFDYVPDDLELSDRDRVTVREHWGLGLYFAFLSPFARLPKPLGLGVCFLAWVAFVTTGVLIMGWLTPPSTTLVIIAASGMVIAWLVAAIIGRWLLAPIARSSLCDLGYDVCIKCDYWLRGLGDEVKQCPECGAKREPIAERRNRSDEPSE